MSTSVSNLDVKSKMLKQSDTLDLGKCIASRLWYVATIIHRRESIDRCRHRRDVKKLKSLISSCVEQGSEKQRWIAYNLSFMIDNDEETRRRLAREEFVCTLNLLDTRMPDHSKEELLRLFEAVEAAVQKTEVPIRQLSQETLEYLETKMLQSPALVHWIIERLLCIWLPSRFAQTDSLLQEVYFSSIRKLLDMLVSPNAYEVNVPETISHGNRKKSTDTVANVSSEVLLLSILSKLNLTEAKEDELLEWLYPALLQTSINFDHLELALYCRKNHKFYRAWHEFLDAAYFRCRQVDSLDVALKVSRILFRLNERPIGVNVKELFKRVLRRRSHWVTEILDICFVFLMNERYDEVEEILSIPALENFWFPLLFKLLKDCPNVPVVPHVEKSASCTGISGALNFMLNKLSTQECNDATLERLKRTVEHHTRVLNWILKEKRMSIEAGGDCRSSSSICHDFSPKYVLSLLQNHSVLAVLKMTTNIHEKSYEDINALLSEESASRNTFQAYRALLTALKAVLRCDTYNENYQRVADHLDEMEKLLGSLFPLDLRMQVIENVFSLLFLRYEDFADIDSSSDIGEEESTTIRTQTLTPPSEVGFVCNKYAIREIIARLRRSVMGLKLEFTDQKRDGGVSTEICESLESGISRISETLTDAAWRLEILTSRDFVERQGKPDTSHSKSPVFNDSPFFRDERLGYSANTKQKTMFYKPSESSSDESEFTKSDLDGSSETGSQGNSTRRKKRSKNHSSRPTKSSSLFRDSSKKRERTLNCMLASKDGLILQCLRKGDYDKAIQVIEMFGLKNSRLEGEILFSRAMHTFRKEMRAQWDSMDSVDSIDGVSEQSTLQKIRKAVQDGYQKSRTTSQIETFLAAQEPSVRLMSTDGTSAKELLTLASLDLALTMSRTHQDSINLSDVTMSYLRSCKKIRNTRFQAFFESIHQLLYEDQGNLSIRRILCDARIPLSLKEAREKNEYWSRLSKKLDAFKQSSLDNWESNVDEATSEGSIEWNDKNLQDLINMCDNGEVYLSRLYAHLKLLRTIVPESCTNLGDNLKLLETSLDTYIGDQIFRLNIELEEIESIASRLGVDLVHSILVNCCPKLPCYPDERGGDNDTWGFVVLNKIKDPSPDRTFHDPDQCVREILSELVEKLREETSPNYPTLRPVDAKDLAKKPKIRDVLAKTHRLATLDLCNLSFGHHTLAFFVNIWNLAMIHALLEVWSKDPPIGNLRHEISFSSVGYDIGDLGTVSLAALRSKLLGRSQLWGSRYFSQTAELNEPAWLDLDVPVEPRVLFAMINEYEDSPVVRVYELETLDADLKAAMNDYVDYHENRKTSMQQSSGKLTSGTELVRLYNVLMGKKSISGNEGTINKDDNNAKADHKFTGSFRYSYHVNLSYEKESHTRDTCEPEKASDETLWQNRVVKPKFLQYLEGRCWLLSYLVQRIHDESPTILDSNCENLGRTAALENLLKSTWINDLKYLYGNNETVAGLSQVTATKEMWDTFETLLASDEAERCLTILKALPESLVFNNIELQRLTDKILAKLTTNTSGRKISDIMSYIYQIKDEHILAQIILENVNDLPIEACQESLMHVLSHRNKDKLPAHCKSRMNEILCQATVFRKTLPYCSKNIECENEAWHNVVYHTEKTNVVRIVKSLIDANQYELCLEWLEYQAVLSDIHSFITQDLLVGLLTHGSNDFKHPLKLLRALPLKKSLNLCKSVLGKLESIEALRFVVNYLWKNTESNESAKFRGCLLGIDILEQLEIKERRFYIHLIEQPLLMLEQLLMNCRLDSLQKIVVTVHEKYQKRDLYVELFDETLRFYAKKALDFRVAVQTEAADKVKDASVSSNISQSSDFVMPVNIPTKEDWIPNDKARECSCCRIVIFSMFNRRHHCRRCGRVVCGACSPQRMRLPSYPNSVPVRVCNDCKRQSLVQLQTATSTPSSETFDCWRLNADETHNKTLRDEFSFENAPNISLCLAILNLHSDHEAYSNFLLDRCDEMKFLLRPDRNGRVNPEIDHALIIKMIRSLLVAAKVKCAELGLNTGLTHCDRFLSHVDLIATLVNSECSHLIPRMDKDDYLDDHTLRKLRDMLTEKEQWTIALDVSTKTGLDKQGVWAAWGTACLKVGYYERAREKFSHCLDRVSREDSDDWVMLSYPCDSQGRSKSTTGELRTSSDESTRRSISSSKSLEGLKTRPSKDPPLLTEILQILEKINPNDAYANPSTAKPKCTGAQEILNTLSNLKAISQGRYAPVQSWTNIKNTRYQESLYYLLMYGSFNSILEFFVKHGEYEKCLAYIIENDLEPEFFMSSVFLPCMKNGDMMNLCEAMRSKDSSLITFKKYLMHTCHSLERKQLLHTLHQLQLFMKDYVRAAMTCIRFYVTDAVSYEDLCSRTRLLVEAQKHLESELQLENFGKKRRKSVTSNISGQNNLTLEMDPIEIDRHINTISRQMEIAKFLGSHEQEGRCVSEFMTKLSYMDSEGSSSRIVPTLFGNQQEKTHLAVLAILCGRDVEEGFGIAFRIMQDYNLRPQKIYSLVGHMLALDRKIGSIEQLIKCCRSSGAPNSSTISDRVLAHCVKLLLDRSRPDSNPSPKDQIDGLIRIITDVELKIDSYIESRQLKAAYLLAVKHSRAQDIRKILKEADRMGQLAIKSICTKWLQQTQKSRGDV